MAVSKGKELIFKAREHLINQDVINAEIYFTQALNYDDSKLEAHENLGNIYLNKGDVFNAISHWESALAIDDSNFESLTNLGYMLCQVQRLDEATVYLEKAHQIEPQRDDVAMQLAQIKMQAGNVDAGLSLLEPFVKSKSGNENVYLLVAQAQAMKNDQAGAEATLNGLLAMKPNQPEALINLGHLSEAAGEIDKALGYYERVITEVPYHVHAKIEYGRFLSSLGRLEEALVQLQDAAKLKPGEWTVQVHLGNAYQESGEFEKAIRAYKKALTINPEDIGTRQNLSRVLTRFVPPWHLKMLADHERNEAFEKAIEKAVNADSVALDIGTGSGILSMMAARAGAKKVYTCEQSTFIADAAKENIKKNGYKKQIKLFAKKSTQLTEKDLPEKPNVIVAEIFDAGLLGEHAVPSFRHALGQLCEPDTQVIPKSADIKGKLIHAERLASVNPMKDISGLDLSAFDQFRVPEEYITQNLAEITHEFCSDEFDMMSVDFTNSWEPFAPGQYRHFDLDIKVTSDQTIHGVAFWFNLHLDDEITLDSAPGRPDNHWGQALSFFPQAIQAKAGDTLKLPVGYHDIKVWFGQPQVISKA